MTMFLTEPASSISSSLTAEVPRSIPMYSFKHNTPILDFCTLLYSYHTIEAYEKQDLLGKIALEILGRQAYNVRIIMEHRGKDNEGLETL